MKRFGLPAGERIKNKKDFERIFSNGRIIHSSDKRVRAAYIIESGSKNPGIKIAVAVSRKSGIAVWRNRVKRLLRESYRLNKEHLLTFCIENGFLIKIVFSPFLTHKKKASLISLDDFMPGTIDVLNKIKSSLL